MKLYVLDESFLICGMVDAFTSFIWNDRYWSSGDFELQVPATSEAAKLFNQDYYLQLDGSPNLMIIEGITIKSDASSGAYLTVTGRSLSSILERRIVWRQTTVSGNLQNAIERLMNENMIYPGDGERKIPDLVFKRSDDPNVTRPSIVETQYTGDNLYEIVSALCKSAKIGFKIERNEDLNRFEFSMYYGIDRSWGQDKNPWVVFSPKWGNLSSSNFATTTKEYKSVADVGGEGDGNDRKWETVYANDKAHAGLLRRELYVDARDVSTKVGDRVLPDWEYHNNLRQRGTAKLNEVVVKTTFDGQAETHKSWEYGTDFFMGDIVQIQNEYGMESKSRITEFIRSWSASEYKAYPTFTDLDAA